MKLLIVGGGGREHALAWKAAQSPLVTRVYVAPGNAGTELEDGIENVAIGAEDIDALLKFAATSEIGLTIVGPEAPLVAGIVDRFEAAGKARRPSPRISLPATRFRARPTRVLPRSTRPATMSPAGEPRS
jgi:phosphoribosylamine-glycine ligase